MNYKILDFPIHGDERGKLIALEKCAYFPFEIKRVYYIYGTKPDTIRGKHAHKNLEQVIICLSGSCDFLLDDGLTQETIHLDNPSKGLYIKHTIWREFKNFSSDCILMVLANKHYNEKEYVRDYAEFLRISEGKNL